MAKGKEEKAKRKLREESPEEIAAREEQRAIKRANRVAVISDTHLYGTGQDKRTRDQIIKDIKKASRRAGTVVLNGDIFEALYPAINVQDTTDNAIQLLEELSKDFPETNFEYVLGNHDCVKSFVEQVEEFASSRENVHVHREHLRIGNTLFLHGDLPVRKQDLKERELVTDPSQVRQSLGGAIIHSFRGAISKTLDDRFFAPKKVSERIYKQIMKQNPELLEGVDNIVFGHTHVPFTDYTLKIDGRKVRFHNTGTGVEQKRHNIIYFKKDDEESLTLTKRSHDSFGKEARKKHVEALKERLKEAEKEHKGR